MEAKCVSCRRVVDATYDFRPAGAFLVRRCDLCGESETIVSTQPTFFREATRLAEQGIDQVPQGLIVELLDQCDIQCPTCIAGSSPFLRNLRDVDRIRQALLDLKGGQGLSGVFLSGGEPAIHPRLTDFIDVVDDLGLSRKVLITNGLRLARDKDFAAALLPKLHDGWEVFLQFDVLDPDVLRDIRGDDFVADHLTAVELLGEASVATTLVAVAKRGVSLERVAETVAFGLEREWVRGVQIQPIREAGRLENYNSTDNTCLTSDVHEVLEEAFPGMTFRPYAGSPLSVSMAYVERGNKSGVSAERQPAEMYLDATVDPFDRFRVVVMEYSDDHNWSSLRLKQSALAVLQADGSAKRVDDHWDPVGIDLGPLRVK